MLVVTFGIIMFLLSGSLPYYQLFSFTSAGSLGSSTDENVTTTNIGDVESVTGVDLVSNPSGEVAAYDLLSDVSTAEIESGDASTVGSTAGSLDDYSEQAGNTGSSAGQGPQIIDSNNTTNDGSSVPTGASGSTNNAQPNDDAMNNQSPQTTNNEDSGESYEGNGPGSSSSSSGSTSNSTSSPSNEASTTSTTSNQSSPSPSSTMTSNKSSISVTESESPPSTDIGGDAFTQDSSKGTDTSVESLVSEQDLQVASATNPNSVEHTISSGDGQNVNIGSVSNTENVSATISLDKSSYNLAESPVVTVNDGEANVDPNAVNSIQIIVSSSSDSLGIFLTLTETGPNTGVFQGAFSFTSGVSSPTDGTIKIGTGDQLGIQYVGTHPRLQVEISGVQQGGSVSLTQVARPVVENPPFLLGAAVEITYGPEVQLIPNGVLGEDCPEGLCEGTMTLEMSYANSPLCIDSKCQNPEALTIWQYLDGVGWVDLRDFQPLGTIIQVDTNTKTVSAFTPFKGGILSLGTSTGSGGGGGGSLALPGAGIVLDLIAPVVTDQEPTPTPDEAPTESQLSDNGEVIGEGVPTSISGESTDNSTSLQGQGTGTLNTDGPGTSQQAAPGSENDAISMNKTIAVPGVGNVTLSSSNLDVEHNFEVTALKDPDFGEMKITKSSDGRTMTVSTQNGTKYDLVGAVLNIGPNDLDLNGTLTVSIPYDNTQIPNSGSGQIIRLIYYSGSSWEDVTVEPFANGKIVTGSLADIGPVAAAIKSKAATNTNLNIAFVS